MSHKRYGVHLGLSGTFDLVFAVKRPTLPLHPIGTQYIWERPAQTGHRARAVPFSRKRRSVKLAHNRMLRL